MNTITTQELAQACRIFLDLAYPGGVQTIPANKRSYYDITPNSAIEDFLIPAEIAVGICQVLAEQRGYAFRLGSAGYPHLKLRIETKEVQQRQVWVYSVDTHDGFHKATKYLSPEETEAWRVLVDQNRDLKHQIETAFAAAEFITPKVLLQMDLAEPVKPSC